MELREAGGADASKDYWTCFNSCQRTLVRLEQRLRVLGLDRGATAKRAVSVVEFYRARQQAGLSARDGQDDE